MSLLARPLDPAAPKVAGMTVTLYTRAQCCCCQTAREVLSEYREAYGFTFEEVDASDPALTARIGATVPGSSTSGCRSRPRSTAKPAPPRPGSC